MQIGSINEAKRELSLSGGFLSAGLCFLMFLGFVLFEFGWLLDRPLFLAIACLLLGTLLQSCLYFAYETKCQQVHHAPADWMSALTLDQCHCVLPDGTKVIVP
jgi:hypothetical protein